MRRGVLCSLCNWNKQRFFHPGAETISYSIDFCTELSRKFIDATREQFVVAYRFLLLVDEFVLLTTGRGMTSRHLRSQYRHFGAMVNRCAANVTHIENCYEYCREFNINRISPLFDGDHYFAHNITKSYDYLKPLLFSRDPTRLRVLFKFRYDQWSEESMRLFVENESLFSTRRMTPPPPPYKKPKSFEVKFKTRPLRNYLEYRHHLSSLQIEDTEDDFSVDFPLYRVEEQPKDFSEFLVIIEPKGLSYFKEANENRLDFTVDKLVATFGEGDADKVNEVLDESVKGSVGLITVSDIREFLHDARMSFRKISKRQIIEKHRRIEKALDMMKYRRGRKIDIDKRKKSSKSLKKKPKAAKGKKKDRKVKKPGSGKAGKKGKLNKKRKDAKKKVGGKKRKGAKSLKAGK